MKLSKSLFAVFSFAFLFGHAAHANSPIVVDANGHAVGYLSDSDMCPTGDAVAVYSKNSYLACFSFGASSAYALISPYILPPGDASIVGPVQGTRLYYSTTDCSGQAYVGSYTGGFVLSTPIGILAARFVPGEYQPYFSVQYASPTCSPDNSNSSYFLMPVDPATPQLTSFNPSPYKAPLMVEVLPDSVLDDVIFFDSFDESYPPAT